MGLVLRGLLAQIEAKRKRLEQILEAVHDGKKQVLCKGCGLSVPAFLPTPEPSSSGCRWIMLGSLSPCTDFSKWALSKPRTLSPLTYGVSFGIKKFWVTRNKLVSWGWKMPLGPPEDRKIHFTSWLYRLPNTKGWGDSSQFCKKLWSGIKEGKKYTSVPLRLFSKCFFNKLLILKIFYFSFTKNWMIVSPQDFYAETAPLMWWHLEVGTLGGA